MHPSAMLLRCTLLAAAILAQPALAQQSPASPAAPPERRVLQATWLEGAVPLIDGVLDDPVWRTAEAAADFVQREPTPGATATARTEARIAYDAGAIYVAMRMYDPHPDSIQARLTRRDDATAVADWAAVFLDSYHDRRTAFKFATTPRGVRVDAMLSEDTREDPNWDAVWEVATQIDSLGWTAEFRIPLSQLRYSVASDGKPMSWGVEFMREISRRSEISYWAPLPPSSGRMVSLFGELRGMGKLASARRVEIMPYTAARLTRAPGDASDPFYSRNDLGGSAGADIKYGLTSNLTLTATVTPDFGQVEADPSVVNLGSFETFLPEKRPFFVEGAEIFRFALVPEGNVFYSRRIGRQPQRTMRAPVGGFMDAPETARILGAAKLSGKTAQGWSVGLLHAVTDQANARLADSTGAQWTEPVEPLTHYSVGRLVRDFRRGQSGVGVIATSTVRDLSDERLNLLRSHAYATGGNWWHRFGGNRFQFSGWALGTLVRGSPEAMAALQRNSVHRFQRPDAAHLEYDSTRTRLSGWAGETFVTKIAGNWTWNVGGGARSPGVDVNEGGYQTYADLWYLAAFGGYRQFRPGPYLRNWNLQGRIIPAWTFGGERIRSMGEISATGQLHNMWGGSVTVSRWLPVTSPWELRGGPGLRTAAYTDAAATVYTNRRRASSLELQLRGSYAEETGEQRFSIAPALNLRPSPRATVSLAPVAAWNRDPDQYIRTVGAGGRQHYLLGHLDQTTAALVARLSYAFTPTLSFDFYAQPFLSAGRYSEIKEVTAPQAERFSDRFVTFRPEQLRYDPAQERYSVDLQEDGTTDFSFGNPNFSVREFRANAVLRWEYRPGSTLFLVWSEARDDRLLDPGLRLNRDLERLFGGRPRDVLLLKVSYWMGR